MNKATIMIIDDSEHVFTVLSRLLGDTYHVVHHNGEGNINKAVFNHMPQCILLDYTLKDRNGMEVLKSIKNEMALSSLPIIMLSSNRAPECIIDCMRQGAVDYVLKDTFLQEDIVSIIGNTLSVAEKLNRKELLYTTVATHTGLFTWEVDSHGIFTYIDPIIEKVLYYPVKYWVRKKTFSTLSLWKRKNKIYKHISHPKALLKILQLKQKLRQVIQSGLNTMLFLNLTYSTHLQGTTVQVLT